MVAELVGSKQIAGRPPIGHDPEAVPDKSLVLTTSLPKVKVKLSLCSTEYHAMKTYGRVEV